MSSIPSYNRDGVQSYAVMQGRPEDKMITVPKEVLRKLTDAARAGMSNNLGAGPPRMSLEDKRSLFGVCFTSLLSKVDTVIFDAAAEEYSKRG